MSRNWNPAAFLPGRRNTHTKTPPRWRAVVVATLFAACGSGAAPEADLTGSFNYGTTENPRQVLDLYRAASATVDNPGPIYLWAHPNGSTYRSNLPSDSMRKQLRDRGV